MAAGSNAYRGKVSVITGAASGIGRELARQLAARGARLAISDVEMAGLTDTARACGGAEVRTYRVDVASRAEVFGHADAVARDFGTAHFVFNNAGVSLGATVEHATIEEIEWQLGINLWGVIYGTKAFLPMLLAQREGHIVNISSAFGLVAVFGQGAYNISKFGVRALTECLWWELEGTGVRATSVHPGGIRTNIAKAARMGAHTTEVEESLRPLVDKLLSTPPADCARDILDGVAKGKRRILTGNGVCVMDAIARLLPAQYGRILKAVTGL